MRRTLIAGLAAAGLIVGCGGEEEAAGGGDGAAEQAGSAATGDGDRDPAAARLDAAREALQGTWAVARGDKLLYTVEVDGDRIAVTDHRFKPEKTQSGTLTSPEAHAVGVELADGTVYRYSWASIDGHLRFGMGDVYPVDGLDDLTLPLSRFESLERDAAGCRWVKVFGDKRETRDVACGVTEREGRRVFTYQVPDPFEDGALADRELVVVDGLLVDEELLTSVAARR